MAGRRFRIVIDTNVLIAASRSTAGASAAIVVALGDGAFDAAVSKKLILEYEEVLRREIEGVFLSADDVTRFVDFMAAKARHVEPTSLLRPVLDDPDDDFVLELAFAARVDYVVTHNVRDFRAAASYGVRAITPGAFLQLLRGQS